MPNFDLKKKLLVQLKALKILNTGFPQISVINSFPSLNSKNNPLDFLIDLVKSLIGFDQLKDEVINFLTYQIIPLENTLKLFLKNILRKNLSCSIDAEIPEFLITDGINVSISQIDFFDLFKIDPSSQSGQLLYGSSQEDFNHFLFDAIQESQTNWKNILIITFLDVGIVEGVQKTNVLNFKISPNYSGKKINTWVNDFLNSITILSLPLLINNIFDSLFGTISLNSNNSLEHFKNKEEINEFVEKIINLPDIEIDDSYYEFTKFEINTINERAKNKSKGVTFLKSCSNVPIKIDVEELEYLTEDILDSSTLIEKKNIINNRFETIFGLATVNVPENDLNVATLELYGNFFRAIIKGIVNIFLSPKIIALLVIYFKIVNLSIGFVDFKSFFEQYRQFIVNLIKNTLLPILTSFLMKLILKLVQKLVAEDVVNKKTEQLKYYTLAIQSLVGISSQTRSLLNIIE